MLCSALLCTSLLSCLALLPYTLLPLPCRPLQSLFLPPYPLPSRPVLFGPFSSLTVPSLRVLFLAVLSLSVPSLTIPFCPFKSFSVLSQLFEMFYSWIWILVILFPRGCTFQLIFTFRCLESPLCPTIFFFPWQWKIAEFCCSWVGFMFSCFNPLHRTGLFHAFLIGWGRHWRGMSKQQDEELSWNDSVRRNKKTETEFHHQRKNESCF